MQNLMLQTIHLKMQLNIGLLPTQWHNAAIGKINLIAS